MIDMRSPEFILFVLSYGVFLVYVVRHFWNDLTKYMEEGMSKREAKAAVHKDYRRGLFNPKHKMFIPGLYIAALFIYWVVSGILQQ